LQLVRRWTRSTYREAFHQQAPPFDPSRPAQPWFDSTAGRGDDYTYSGFDPRAGEGLKEFTISGDNARSPNLSGEYEYPKHRPVTTPAVVKFVTGEAQPLSPLLLSSASEAEALLAELVEAGLAGDSAIKEMGMPSSTILWNGEARRIHVVDLGPKRSRNVGHLIRRRNSGGTGHPGHWVIHPGTGAIGWVLDEPDEGIDDWDLPVPLRPLVDGERIVRVGFGVVVTRAPEGGDTGGGFPVDMRQKIDEIHAKVMRAFGG
jgi:hypothetical protein